jgi:uncharacterized protein with GYD domain
MPTFISLASWTEEGIRNIKDSPGRLDQVKQMYRDAGAELKAFYMTMGRCDMVVIAEAPDDETVARLALRIGASGAVRTETLKAFTEDEYRSIIGSMP